MTKPYIFTQTSNQDKIPILSLLRKNVLSHIFLNFQNQFPDTYIAYVLMNVDERIFPYFPQLIWPTWLRTSQIIM